MRLLALALALAAIPSQGKQEKKQLDQKIEELFGKLASEKDEAQRTAARAELEALGKPVLPILKKFLDDELARAKKAREKAETIADRYVPRLDDEAIESRESAMLTLIAQGEAILPGLKKHEKSPSAEIRARVKQVVETIEARRTGGRTSRLSEDALLLFSRLADPSSAATVSGFFEGRDPELRLQAVKTFHEIALPADLPKLKPLLADADLKVRAAACLAVTDLGLDAAVPVLLDLVRTEKDANVWRAALNGMVRWRSLWTPDLAAKVAELIPVAAPDRRAALIGSYFLGGRLSETPEALIKVFRLLAPAEKAVLLKPWGTPEDPAWVAAVRILATDPDPTISAPAAALYGYAKFIRMGGASIFVDKYDTLPADERLYGICALVQQEYRTQYAIKLLLHETDPVLRKALFQAGFQNPTFITGFNLKEALQSGQRDLMLACADVTHHNQVEALALVKYLYQTTADPVMKAHLGLGLANDGYVPAAEHIAPFLKDPSVLLRLRAVEAVGAVQARELCDALVPMLKDPEPRLRTAAAQALLRSGDSKYFEPLWALRTEQGLESYAVQAFGKYGKASEADRLEKLMKETPAAAYAVPNALFHLSPMEPHPLLQKLAQDKDSNVRSNVARELANIKIAAALPQQIVDAANGKGSFPTLEVGFSSRIVFVTAAECTSQVAGERRAVPLPLKEFLLTANPSERNYAPYSLFSSGCPRDCPKEILDQLTPDNPRLPVLLRLLRGHPYPEVGARLAAMPANAGAGTDFLLVLSWSDPLLLRERLMEGIQKGSAVDGTAGLSKLSEFLPADEHVALLLKLSKNPDAAMKAAADQALASLHPGVLCTQLADGRFSDRALVLRSLVRMKVPGTLPTIEESLKDKDPNVRALAAVALMTAKGAEATAIAIPFLKDATGDVAWELAAKIIVYVKEEHRPLLPTDSTSAAVHALLARLGRKESAAKVLSEFPPTDAGKMAAGMALAPHFDAAVEAKLLPLLSATPERFVGEGALGLCAALAHSPEASTRARVLAANRGLRYLDNRIHPAELEALEALIARGDAGAVQKAAIARGSGPGREPMIALLRKAGTDEAAAALIDFLNVPPQELPEAVLVLESIKAQIKGPKTREKLQQILKTPNFVDLGLLAPLVAEVGVSVEFEDALEQKAKGANNYVPSLGAMQLLARSPTGVERLKKLSKEMGASQDSRHRTYGAFAALLSGLPVPADEWRVRYLQGGGMEATLLVGQLRIVETVPFMLRQKQIYLAATSDAGLAAALPLLTCQDFRPPEPSQPDYWPRLSKFLADLGVWVKKNRGRSFEEIFAEALKARGLAVAGKAVGAADAATLVAALEDKDDFIAANADWMLRRIPGLALPPALSVMGDDGQAQELKAKYGQTLLTVTFGTGRWTVRRPAPDEVAAWKKWLAARK